MMRHTFAMIARMSEVNPRLVADFLGHKNTSMTDHYTHKTVEGMQNVVELRSKHMH
jgi:integrase